MKPNGYYAGCGEDSGVAFVDGVQQVSTQAAHASRVALQCVYPGTVAEIRDERGPCVLMGAESAMSRNSDLLTSSRRGVAAPTAVAEKKLIVARKDR